LSDQTSNTEPADANKVEQLIREGIAAAKAGDKATARSKLREAVALDQYSEKGWFWLASVVESEEEKRVCLGNVVVINPNNTRAQQMLDALTEGSGTGRTRGGAALIPQSRRLLYTVGGIIVVALLLVIVVFRPSPAQVPEPTALPPGVTPDTATPINSHLTQTVESVETAAQGTLDARRTANALPPEWTATATRPPAGTLTPTALPAPAGAVGRLLVIQGNEMIRGRILNFKLIDLATGETRDLLNSDTRGDYAVWLPDGRRILFGQFFPGTNQLALRQANLNGAQAEDLGALWGNNPALRNQGMPSVAANGFGVVFAGQNVVQNDQYPNIYYLPARFSTDVGTPTVTLTPTPPPSDTATPTLDPTFTVSPTFPPTLTVVPTGTPAPLPLTRLTERNTAIYSWPDISADGGQVVFVSDTTPVDEGGSDLYVVSVGGGSPANVTNDGPAFLESAPAFSPDGSQIVFAAAAQGSDSSDLYVMNADGSNKRPLVTGGNNMRPVWSPDGRFVGFSSQRTGKWEVYVVDVASGTVYQVTNTSDTTILTDWGP
jgi:Tol biopolymer transport system component